MNLKLLIAYDGTAYLGWQKTNTGQTIEETLENTLSKILQEPVTLQAASRTDAGVHAEGQVVNFITAKETLNLSRLRVSLNQLLPRDIVVRLVEKAPDSFHPTLDARWKEYHYYVCNASVQMPQYRHTSYHYYYPLDLDRMRKAAAALVGEHDFSAFCNVQKNSEVTDFVRHLKMLEIIQIKDRLLFRLVGNRFLYRMARNIVGTLLEVGRGKIDPLTVPDLLKAKDRTLAGITAPAHGLTLYQVYYS